MDPCLSWQPRSSSPSRQSCWDLEAKHTAGEGPSPAAVSRSCVNTLSASWLLLSGGVSDIQATGG